jgi:exodeoxyribonuclease VII large subunit
METTARLSELMQHLQRVISLNFSAPVWITAEVAQHKLSRGHTYLQLVEKATDSDTILAQTAAVLWSGKRQSLEQRLGSPLDTALQEGHTLRICVRPDHHPVYGFKLLVEDMDLSYSLGQLALRRQKIIDTLRREHLLDKNRGSYMPPVIQRIAVVSSPQAAGWKDFEQHLLSNPMGYAFRWQFFEASMQGQAVEEEVDRALARIAGLANYFDIAVLLRGGGSKMDLAWFDNERLGRRIAAMPVPVLTGIGHDIDETICDLVAYATLKTPTAVANWIIDHNFRFENKLGDCAHAIRTRIQQRCSVERARLQQNTDTHRHIMLRRLDREHLRVHQVGHQLHLFIRQQLRDALNHLDHMATRHRHLDPQRTLLRGYSITLYNGKPLLRAEDVPTQTRIETLLADGHITSTTD